jgi:hypothetical protein
METMTDVHTEKETRDIEGERDRDKDKDRDRERDRDRDRGKSKERDGNTDRRTYRDRDTRHRETGRKTGRPLTLISTVCIVDNATKCTGDIHQRSKKVSNLNNRGAAIRMPG